MKTLHTRAVRAALSLALCLTCSLAQAGVTLETPHALIYSFRPIESFTPDEDNQRASNKLISEGRIAYTMLERGKLINGGPKLFEPMTETPVTLAVKNLLPPLGGKLQNGNTLVFMEFNEPVRMDRAGFEQFLQTQHKAYEAAVLEAGDPDQMRSNLKLKNAAFMAFNLLTLGIGLDKTGISTATAVTVGTITGVSQHVQEMMKRYANAAAMNPETNQLAAMDWSAYQSFEVRRIQHQWLPYSVGQIILAFKSEAPDEQVRTDTLARAIVLASGLNSPAADRERAMQAARKQRYADYARLKRQGQ